MQAPLQTLCAAHGSAFRDTRVAGPKREPLAVLVRACDLTAFLLLRPANAFFFSCTQDDGREKGKVVPSLGQPCT
jgi:hypothetical protein